MTSGPLPVSPTTNSTLLWDAENRLTEVKNSAGTTLEQNLFDASSRKIATTVNGITTLYLYDGWNCIAEYTRSVGVSPTLQKTRLWGTDLSGTPQGAGGVGGMLSESSPITSNPITFNSSYPTYDGNGNVSEYLDSTGQVIAHFEYDPFGNTVVNTDTANLFTYRFSTNPEI
jgi:YD repeat-containing protein